MEGRPSIPPFQSKAAFYDNVQSRVEKDGERQGREKGWRKRKNKYGSKKKETLTFLVATNISTRRCLMRLEVSSGKGVLSAVSSPISCVHVVPDEKKLKGKHFSTTILAAKSSRTLNRGKQSQNRRSSRAATSVETGKAHVAKIRILHCRSRADKD